MSAVPAPAPAPYGEPATLPLSRRQAAILAAFRHRTARRPVPAVPRPPGMFAAF